MFLILLVVLICSPAFHAVQLENLDASPILPLGVLPRNLTYCSNCYEKTYDSMLKLCLDTIRNVNLTKITAGTETNYYYFSSPSDKRTVASAISFCRANGMALANIDTIIENEAILAAANVLLDGTPEDFFWIDVSDATVEGEFIWTTTGFPITLTWAKSFGFFANEPTSNIFTNDGIDQNCVDIVKRGTCTRWEDRDCLQKGRFIGRVGPICRDILNFKENPVIVPSCSSN